MTGKRFFGAGILAIAALLSVAGISAVGRSEAQDKAGPALLLAKAKKTVKKKTPAPAVAPKPAALTTADFDAGVKDALLQAVKGAVARLGKKDGFFLDQAVRIPMPAQLKPLEDTLRSLGQGKVADSFIESMNRAAEEAVPGTAAIFSGAVAAMTLEEAANLVKGPENAVTQYFETHTREQLAAQIGPVVAKAMATAQVTRYYLAMTEKATALVPFLKSVEPDLNQYVTGKALDGLFLAMADEEKKIRRDPVARSTEILKKVFGAIFK